MTEKQIKCLFLQEMIKENRDLLFASIEVPIIGGKRKMDILSVEKNNIVGYEIKSAKDNLTKLEGQLEDYLKICDKVYVILDKKFSNSIVKLPQDVGIYFFDIENKKFILNRKAKKNTPLAYYQSLFIAQNTLKEYRERSNQTAFEIRHHIVQKFKKTDLKKMIISELSDRYMENFLLLRSEFERNLNTIHPDDLFLLFGKISIEESV
ncbi:MULTISPECIES: MmcB family DNA repair protein [unclassified Helicobacter]|uniref:MmcB family DNA repair protein n=1 Tax=unclassified Helicobacter TaxID=2593540 RepID=UPI000CF09422|nr:MULTISPECIES: MmcB family DNA repair protein [unclassified Helicobacter]